MLNHIDTGIILMADGKKIRFYHWWIYELYYWAWTPILASRPDMVEEMIRHHREWLKMYYQTKENEKSI